MHHNYNHDSFEKGKDFEEYVEKRLFPEEDYKLLHRTNSYDQNSQRYVGDSRLPDFRFKHILTGKEFHIEAKYRTKPFNDEYPILSNTQVETFKNVHTSEIPVYIVLGYGGRASHPAYLSLIPYAVYQEPSIPVAVAYQHKINRGSVKIDLLHTASKPAPNTAQNNTPVESVKNTESQETSTSKNAAKPRLRKKSVFQLGIAAAALIIIVISAIWGFSSLSPEPESILEQRIATYYQLSDANNLKELVDYFSPELDYWYGIKNPTPQEVIDNIKAYRKQYPYSETTVDWDRFSITPQSNGEFYATYPLEYKVRSKETGSWRTYDLKLITVWDNAYRLVSIQEVK